MSSKIAVAYARALNGVNAPLVTIEVHIGGGSSHFFMVGLPEKALKESRERVSSAIINSYYQYPMHCITVNLAPADLPKDGGRFDLAIAIAILAASDQVDLNKLRNFELIGELGLSGIVRPVNGILPSAIECKKANRILVVPQENAFEASLVKGLSILPIRHIGEICAHLQDQHPVTPYDNDQPLLQQQYALDMEEVIGQPQARRALEIAAAGGHSLLMSGPPGTGKTMLASRLSSILPDMTEPEALQTAAIASISHKGFHFSDWKKRPFRSPHHSASSVALVGGGNPPMPGEISLAHHGVLFLDELPEFSRSVLEALREPLESGSVTISRAARQCEFPSGFQLIAAMNPCPCGYHGDKQKECRCSPDQIQRYKHKISGPLLDRIDLHIHVERIATQLLTRNDHAKGECSDSIRERVSLAREKQLNRDNICNAQLSQKQVKTLCILGKDEQLLLENAIDKFNLSARAFHRIVKVSRTIADLSRSEGINKTHLAEALSFRLF